MKRRKQKKRIRARTTCFPPRLDTLIRNHAGDNVSQFARLIGRVEGAIRKWRRGASEPNVTDIRRICEVTGADANWLVGNEGNRK